MKLTVTINMDNAAFEPTNGVEVARLLHYLAEILDGEKLTRGDHFPLTDANGNRVGEARVKK